MPNHLNIPETQILCDHLTVSGLIRNCLPNFLRHKSKIKVASQVRNPISHLSWKLSWKINWKMFKPDCMQDIFARAQPPVRCTRRGLTKKIYAYVYIFRKAPSRTWRVREGALRKIYAYVYIFRKAPSRTWRVREGALRARMSFICYFRNAWHYHRWSSPFVRSR